MPARAFDPSRLDVAAFAAQGATLDGRWPLRSLERVCETAAPEAAPDDADEVVWRVQGEQIPVSGGGPETWLQLDAEAPLTMTCQRCLAPVALRLDVHRRVLFVPGEDAAAELDAERDEDVLALPRVLDLRELIEDELLLAEPLVPLHDVCPDPLPAPTDDDADLAAEHPFAALGALKRRSPPS